MIFNHIMTGIEVDDYEFDDAIYSEPISNLSAIHFTPIDVAIAAAQFLANKPNAKILDIGSGAGKFCMIGAVTTDGHFTGVEQRKNLHQAAQQIAKKRQLPNLEFIHANILEIDFKQFDAFYFFNSFYENIVPIDRIDKSCDLSSQNYDIYSEYVKNQLDQLPKGTRLVTLYSSHDEIPDSYKVQSKMVMKKLTFWEKIV